MKEITFRLFQDGDQWCALIGENLQIGMAAFGTTAAIALRQLADELERQVPAAIAPLGSSAATVATAAGLYYLYRQAGCPLGASVSGFNAWIQVSIVEPFNALAQE